MKGHTMETMDQPLLAGVDRCDRCGAGACVRATLPGGGELIFCGHHFSENDSKLRQLGARIYDQRDTPATAPA